MASRTSTDTQTPAPTEFGLARLMRDIRTAGAEPTHRFPDLDRLYALLEEPPTAAEDTTGVVLQFPSARKR